jgi:hypothetical protein
MRLGLTPAQLRQFVKVMAERGDKQAVERANQALGHALAAAPGH